ncbi:MAG TPA: aminoacyl-tRNA hydrolase [Burkholderiaceae bacterium]|nr:aminoacyl-tRNA hydrolase [Burkholderiaceae bacterium]
MNIALQKVFIKLHQGLDWRLRRLLGDQVVDLPKVMAARCWRPLLRKTAFIGITGSAGKTTAKELLLGVLSAKGKTIGTPESLNVPAEVARLVLRTRPQHDFCVTEIGAARAGSLDLPLKLLQPTVCIVTVIGDDHLSSYASREAIAQEKGKLVACLPKTGTAVLNADDALVRAMASKCAGKVLTYGTSAEADIRATEVSAIWPDRLALTVAYGDEQVLVQSQLCGPHLATPLLGAVAGGIAAGLSLRECADGIASIAPFAGRMQPVSTKDGVTFIRDDFKAPLWTVDACLQFMSTARAKRKIIVVGTLSDFGAGVGAPEKYARIARRAQEIADITVFVGPWASHVLKTRRPGFEDALRVFTHVFEAAQYINSATREGDLVLLKGTNKQDHLLRIVMARSNDIACWRNDCLRDSFCNDCPDRTKPSRPQGSRSNDPAIGNELAVLPPGQRPIQPEEQVIVGLGNPEPKFVDTPHNVGYAAADRIAASMGLRWESHANAWMARGTTSAGKAVCLVKVQQPMNHTGAGLKQLADTFAFSSAQCVLLYDDLDMPMGAVRTRLRGGAAGHRGVVSVLEAFQTDEFRRVKIGVKPAEEIANRAEYVLAPFPQGAREIMGQSIDAAEKRALELAFGSTKKTVSSAAL